MGAALDLSHGSLRLREQYSFQQSLIIDAREDRLSILKDPDKFSHDLINTDLLKTEMFKFQAVFEAVMAIPNYLVLFQFIIKISRKITEIFKSRHVLAALCNKGNDVYLDINPSPEKLPNKKRNLDDGEDSSTVKKSLLTKIWWRQPAKNGSQKQDEDTGLERPGFGECLDVRKPNSAMAPNSSIYNLPLRNKKSSSSC
ncbi:hypothetical protein LINGRAHAP2_LOCUS34724 [Linum grandiflorum]